MGYGKIANITIQPLIQGIPPSTPLRVKYPFMLSGVEA